METRVFLEQYPSRAKCPSELSDRFSYDSTRKQLVFRGFMSKSTYDRLRSLSDDRSFQRAVEQLFRDTSPAAQTTKSASASWLVIASACVVLLAGIVIFAAIL